MSNLSNLKTDILAIINTWNINFEATKYTMSDVMPWQEGIGRSVRSIDNSVLGKIEHISSDHIRISDMQDNNYYYYIPKTLLEVKYGKPDIWIPIVSEEANMKFKLPKEKSIGLRKLHILTETFDKFYPGLISS